MTVGFTTAFGVMIVELMTAVEIMTVGHMTAVGNIIV